MKVITCPLQKKRGKLLKNSSSTITITTFCYYNFSIFPKLLPCQGDKYSYTDALRIYQIDEFLRREIHYFTSRIEKWIKTSVAYHLSHIYESTEYAKAECYLDPALYNSRKTYLETMESFAGALHKSKEPFIEHHFKQRNGCIPIWVLVEELTFGIFPHTIAVFTGRSILFFLD